MNTQNKSNSLAKNVSAVVFMRPTQVLVTRIGTTNWHRYPSMIQHRGFRMAQTKHIRGFNAATKQITIKPSIHQTNHTKTWSITNYNNYSFQMRLALRGYYR
eukprot:83228_1